MGTDNTASLSLIWILAFGSVFLLVYGLQQVLDRRAARLSHHLGRFTPSTRSATAKPGAASLRRSRRRFSTIDTMDTFLNRHGFADRMDRQLASAALPLRVGEYLFIRWACVLALGGLAMYFVNNPLIAVPAGIAGYFAPALYVHFRQRQRTDRLNEQLVDGLALISGGLKAGYSFLQGIEAVVREMPPPIRDELKIVLEDLRIGVPVEQTLLTFARRVPTEDVDMVVTAMLVQRSSGGNLAEILENIAHTVRERIRIRREVMTLTAQERMSSYVVGSLPIVAFVFLTMVNPEYLELFGSPVGQAMLAGAAVLELIGFYIIRRIVDIKL
jgi:tight adherence protein B